MQSSLIYDKTLESW